jgi:REP element-mobilizing transposase RayT
MPRPPVIAYHLIWTAYGWWLPNDPRGSGSRGIANDSIEPLGDIHYGRRRVQPPPAVVRRFYERAGEVLKHPLLSFAPEEFPIIAEALADGIATHRYTCYACAVMPDHVHLLIRRHRHKAEEMIVNLQRATRLHVLKTGIRPLDHPVWTEGGWKGFRDRPSSVQSTVRYIERNPAERGLPAQRWSFVTEYDGWPFHRDPRRSGFPA